MDQHHPIYAWYVVIVLLFLSVLSWLDRQIITFLVDPIKTDLGISDTQFGILAGGAFALFYALMGLPIGRLVDQKNRKYIVAIGVTTWSVMTSCCGLAKDFTFMFLARVGIGVGEATLNPASISIINDLFPREKIMFPIAVFSMSIFIGGGVAIILGGELIQWMTSMESISIPLVGEVRAWRAILFYLGIPGIMAVLLVLFTVKEPPRHFTSNEMFSSGDTKVPFRTIFAFINKNKRFYYGIFAAYAFHSTAVVGMWSWLPAMLGRTFDMSSSEIARTYGVIYLGAGILGAIAIGLINSLSRKYKIRNLLVLIPTIFVTLNIIPSLYAPLAASKSACLIWLGIMLFCMSVTINLSYAVVSSVTPNQMRGFMVALLNAFLNITAGVLGALLVGVFSDYVFTPETIRYSLSLVAIIFMPCSAVAFYISIKGFDAMNL